VISSDLATYVKDAIARLTADGVSSENGSHAVGIFNKAASGFEKRILSYTATVTRRSDLGKLTRAARLTISASRTGEPFLKTCLTRGEGHERGWIFGEGSGTALGRLECSCGSSEWAGAGCGGAAKECSDGGGNGRSEPCPTAAYKSVAHYDPVLRSHCRLEREG
jgi:hypothetical protein